MALTPNTLVRFVRREPSILKIIEAGEDTKFHMIVLGDYAPINITLENVDIKLARMNLSIGLVLSSETTLFFEPVPDGLASTSPYDNGFMVKNRSFVNFIKNHYY